jgi:predicted RNase H-like HicB family nuclease
MSGSAAVLYHVVVRKDPETGNVVAEIPALQLADHGADVPEALDRLQAMLTFHLDCLREEGKPFPSDPEDQEGLFLRVNLPAHAA